MKPLDVQRLADEVVRHDALVVGSGVAGLTAALGLVTESSRPRRVAVVTKGHLGSGASAWAQGGVAAALANDDSAALHAEDTLRTGAGIADSGAVLRLTGEGPDRVRQLIELGAQFDRGADGRLLLGREGAHSRRRILHADGDATGREMVRALVESLRRTPGVQLFEGALATDLVMVDDRVTGLLVHHADGRTVHHRAPVVVLATGGFGQLYARTTNPVEATGDGLAMAARAGAHLVDLEFVQFHPTALDSSRDPLPLVTEALRGEGAHLLDDTGERFMVAEHPMAELAPRDIVARAILARQRAGHRVVLDARDAVGERFPERFPTVYAHCRDRGLDPRREPIPVTPAAHYAMAGIAVDGHGRASLPGLWACGEVSSTGVHGANRLASNSLLEALVFGAGVAEDITGRDVGHSGPLRRETVWRDSLWSPHREVRGAVRKLMWRNVGLLRRGDGLERALEKLETLGHSVGRPHSVRDAVETNNLLTVGRLVTAAALARRESRGAHCRQDFPATNPKLEARMAWTYDPSGSFPIVGVDELESREIA